VFLELFLFTETNFRHLFFADHRIL